MANGSEHDGGTRKVKVWDGATRLFHWALVLLVLLSYLTGEVGGFDFTMPGSGAMVANMTVHMWSGLLILALVLFRIVWGFVGSTSARFSDFVRGPGAVIAYVSGVAKRSAKFVAGHNPAGGLMVVIMLVLLLGQAIGGLFAKEDDFFGIAGPLNSFVSEETAKTITGLHKQNWEIIEILVLVHIAANILYWIVLKQNLIVAMITGAKDAPAGAAVPALKFASPLMAAVVMAAALGVVLYVRSLG
ncbi:MAG: cytochrome b/b6 domain-containing protein [Rhodospirillaceae bacterium]|nr:cytochrome b/b6 domain-containing protein [Rhodospirillaceae bacterium]